MPTWPSSAVVRVLSRGNAGHAAHNKACDMKKDAGDCEEASTKWFYDSKLNKCRLFVYGGCGGNDNRFDTEAKCRAQCVRKYAGSVPSTECRGALWCRSLFRPLDTVSS